MDTSRGVAPPQRSPSVAAFLSFLWPGLGHFYAGATARGVLFAAPPLLVVLVVVLQLRNGVGGVAASLLLPRVALTLLVLAVLLGVWRLLAMADAFTMTRRTERGRNRPGVAAAFAALVLIVVVSHLAVVYGALSFYRFDNNAFVGQGGPSGSPGASRSGTPRASGSGEIGGALEPEPSDATGYFNGPTPDPSEFVAAPSETPARPEDRITVLLTGIDRSANRGGGDRTDTMIVASFDPKTGKVTLINFPRDIARFPLWSGGIFTNRLNALLGYAARHPDEFPDGPMPSLIHELSFLTGVPIHYYAAVDIDGMRRILDIVGGVDIVNQQQIDDATYGFSPTHIGFHLSPGPHHLDASEAMAYMRSRHGGGSDFLRAARQQEVLLALRKELISPASVFKLPALLDAAGQAVKTNFPQDRLGELLNDAKLVNDATIERYVLGPPYSVHPPTTSTNGQYILKLKMDELAALSVKVFGAESTYFQSATAKPRN